jgi:uncharacterized protein (DUF2132 family)
VIKEALIYNILWHSTLNKILTFYKSYDLYYKLRSLFKIHEKKNPDAIIDSIKFLKKSFKQKSTQDAKYLKIATTIEEDEDDDDDDEKRTTPPPVAHGQKSDEDIYIYIYINV